MFEKNSDTFNDTKFLTAVTYTDQQMLTSTSAFSQAERTVNYNVQ